MMIEIEVFPTLAVLNLAFAVVILGSAIADLLLWLALRSSNERQVGLRWVAIVLLATAGVLSAIGGLRLSDEGVTLVLRAILGVVRGMVIVALWSLLIYDLVRLFNAHTRRSSRQDP